MRTKKLYIIRGLPGSGKSTEAREIGCLVIEPQDIHRRVPMQRHPLHPRRRHNSDGRNMGRHLGGSIMKHVIRVFKIPIGNMPPKDVPKYIEKVAKGMKSNYEYDSYFLPIRPDGTGPEIEFYKIDDDVEIKVDSSTYLITPVVNFNLLDPPE